MTVLELIKKDLEAKGLLKKYVILKKDEKGYYIEYAFTEGAPHDNRCLSWYNSYQPNAYKRNGWFKTADGKDLPEEETAARLDQLRRERENRVGLIFELSSFTCGYEENEEEALKESKKAWDKFYPNDEFIPEDHICKVGCPSKSCTWCKKTWTYEEPVKCACWFLENKATMEDFINNYKITMPAVELVNFFKN